jgi:hypothetical protein
MKFIISILILLPCIAFAQVDTISINKNSGSSDNIQLFNSQQITFESPSYKDVMYIKKYDGTTDMYKLSNVNAIVFDGVVSVEDEISQFFKLENYPNPFQESMNIVYSLEKQSTVEISIYGIKGNMIKAFVYVLQESGNHISTWDGTNSEGTKVSSGLYYYTLKANNFVVTKQAIFIK